MTDIIVLLIAQATIVSSPSLQPMGDTVRWDTSVLRSLPIPHSTAKAPVIVAADAMREPELMLGLHRQGEAETRQLGIKSTIPPIAIAPGNGCRKDSEHPMGFEMENDKTLNGRIAIFQCPGFIASIESDDFSHALKVGTSAGFAEPETTAIVNGGALTKRFSTSKNGIRHITYIWIGKAIAHTLALTSKTTSLEKMEVAADHMIDLVTQK